MTDFRDDFRHAVRMFRMNPGFTFTAIGALALGIGINTAIFTVVDAVLLKPLTYPDADRIVGFPLTSPQGNGPGASIPKFHLWGQQTSLFQDVAAYDFGGPGFNLTGDRPEQVHGIHVTQAYFHLFGASAMLGRTFTAQEDSPDGGKVVVLSYGLWQRKFAGNPNVIGTALSLGNEPYTIVGVLGKSFVSDPEARRGPRGSIPWRLCALNKESGGKIFRSMTKKVQAGRNPGRQRENPWTSKSNTH